MISSIQSTQYKSRILSAPVSGREVSAAYLTLGNTEEKETPTRGEYTGLRHAIIETSTITWLIISLDQLLAVNNSVIGETQVFAKKNKEIPDYLLTSLLIMLYFLYSTNCTIKR